MAIGRAYAQEAEYATLRPTSVAVIGERVLPGELYLISYFFRDS